MLSESLRSAETLTLYLPFKQGVRGSSPRWSTKEKTLGNAVFSTLPGDFSFAFSSRRWMQNEAFGRKKMHYLLSDLLSDFFPFFFSFLRYVFSFFTVASFWLWRMWV